jgi:hypothetical protein
MYLVAFSVIMQLAAIPFYALAMKDRRAEE